MILKNTFHKHERLCSKKQMDLLFAKGSSKTVFPVKLIYFHVTEPAGAKAMFVAPKRKFKNARDRNTLKRRMREAYRTSKQPLYEAIQSDSGCHLAFLFIGHREEPFSVIKASVLALLRGLTEEIASKQKNNAKN
ncbi:MAG: ribonuclease P protein component [Bacteroidia bacterium]